ncbi:MAG: NAD(P)H-hydrate dehydratase [Nitrospirae bacterium]|nr:MAG: NAD(P)H-hydrate dehydratase [Nitrospirota bacterium]
MNVVTSREMAGIDRLTIEKFGVPGHVLMERAGVAVAERTKEFAGPKRILVVCGAGNNGGDGLVAARELHNSGHKVSALVFATESGLSPDCKLQLKIARTFGVPVRSTKKLQSMDLHGAFVVDALFGTGLSRPVTGSLADVVSLINRSSSPVLAVDIPSGISSDTGQVLGCAIAADYTVTFGLPKRGHLLYPGAEHTGRLFVENIGFPSSLLLSDSLSVKTVEASWGKELLPERTRCSHKGDYGNVLIVAGSKGKTGAALLASKACLRSGAGLVTLGVPETLMQVFQSSVKEEMTVSLSDTGHGTLSSKASDSVLAFAEHKADLIAIGPGIGVSKDTQEIVSKLIKRSPVPLVIDADGLNSITEAKKILRNSRSPVILTPHPGEMARLTGDSVADIEKSRIDSAVSFSKKTGAYVVLKGVPTVTATPEGRAYINTTGNPGMSTAGSGDVLTGMLAALLGQGLNPEEASILGVYLHGLAGDLAAAKSGEHSLTASNIISFIPSAFISLNKQNA